MAIHSSATLRGETSTRRPGTSRGGRLKQETHIDASTKRRARLIITNGTIPQRTRAMIRYALQRKDRHLAQMVRRIWAGETIIDHVYIE